MARDNNIWILCLGISIKCLSFGGLLLWLGTFTWFHVFLQIWSWEFLKACSAYSKIYLELKGFLQNFVHCFNHSKQSILWDISCVVKCVLLTEVCENCWYTAMLRLRQCDGKVACITGTWFCTKLGMGLDRG